MVTEGARPCALREGRSSGNPVTGFRFSVHTEPHTDTLYRQCYVEMKVKIRRLSAGSGNSLAPGPITWHPPSQKCGPALGGQREPVRKHV